MDLLQACAPAVVCVPTLVRSLGSALSADEESVREGAMRILRALGPRLLDHGPILAGVLENLWGYSQSSVPEALTTLLAAGPAILDSWATLC